VRDEQRDGEADPGERRAGHQVRPPHTAGQDAPPLAQGEGGAGRDADGVAHQQRDGDADGDR
jgi:hypothetical protein